MKLNRDDATKLTRVRWYFVGNDVPFVERPYFFGPRNWDLREWIDDDLGEVQDRRWRNGLPLFNQDVADQPCGTLDQWARGSSDSDDVPVYWPLTTVPVCCPPPPVQAVGGEGTRGAPPPATCCDGFPFPDTMFGSFTLCTPFNFGLCPASIVPMTPPLSRAFSTMGQPNFIDPLRSCVAMYS